MVTSSWFTAALGAVGLLFAADGAMAKASGFRPPSGPSYANIEGCPARCGDSGASTGNWSVFANLQQLGRCKQTMFYDFSLYDQVDDSATNHRIHSCSSFGPDFAKIPTSEPSVAAAAPVDVRLEVGWWEEGFGLAAPGLRSLIRQIRKYVDHGHGETDTPFVMFGQSGQATIGVYIGQGLLNQGISESALKILQDNLENLGVSTPSLAMQLCGPGYDSKHIFGVMVTSNGTFTPIQDAIKTWGNATCLSYAGSKSFPGQASFVTPPRLTNGTTAWPTANSTIRARALHARATCRTVQVESGESCASLATKCGITGAEFTKINSGSTFCATLKPKQHVCCTTGDLPDFRPKPNADGSCYSYQVKRDDNCANLAAEYGLTVNDIEGFNKNTWAWNGCQLLWLDAVLCLSSGSPPFPAPVTNAVCGPQKPGSKPPTDGSNIASLNPCPLNSCSPGTYGCISNCGLDLIKGDGTGAIKIGYFEGYGLGRDCLYQDAAQIDTSKYTHIHFAFGLLTESFEVTVGDILSTYEFGEFKKLTGVKRILSLGGWTFSTHPTTYQIFRNGVKPANRLKMATNIANFVKLHGLEGVEIDWEYPGAPDIFDIPRGEEDEGPNYLAFLVILKNLLPGRSVSIAAPSSYWYLKQYPLYNIGKVVDYIVFMTYDLHGQWDASNVWSQEGCQTGNCLRSQVNLTETRQSLVMISKAGVPGRKIIIGVTSYGRSFDMAQAGCWGPNCFFTGDRYNSNAKKGVCTGTAGYVADAEIAEIMQDSSRVVKSFVDSTSNSDILVYDNNQWVGYMSSATKKVRTTLYTAWGMGGTTDWATDLQTYHPVPAPAKDWPTFIALTLAGENGKADHTRDSSWTQFDCTHPVTVDPLYTTLIYRWKTLNADAAWQDVVRIWQETDSKLPNVKFMASVTQTLRMESAHCELIDNCSCDNIRPCPPGANGPESGPAAELIWDSLMRIHSMHHTYHTALFDTMAVVSADLDHMENTFAPIPEEKTNMWTDLLINLLTLGTLSAAGPFFNSFLKNSAYFLRPGKSVDNLKDTTMTVVGQGTSVAKDLLHAPDTPWKTEDQDKFSSYMGAVVWGWANTTALTLAKLFDGSPESLDVLYKTMSDGKLVDGLTDTQAVENSTFVGDLRRNIAKTFFGYAIPALWRNSGAYAFILDSGLGCSDDKAPLLEYVDDATMKKTGVCVDGRQYYLVSPNGDPHVPCWCRHYQAPGACDDLVCPERNTFSAPPGLDSFGGNNWGSLRLEDVVQGSIRSWIKNGKQNSAKLADPEDTTTTEDLLKVDVTTPGFIRLPVCSPERAFQSWDTTSKGSSDNYPCDIPPGRNFCGDSSFVDQTSAASPKVSDCLDIIKHIQGDGSTQFEVQTVGLQQHQVLESGSCRFGLEATKLDGNILFWMGGQDAIDIINDAVKRFGGSGKVSAYGELSCNGNIHQQNVKWGIY